MQVLFFVFAFLTIIAVSTQSQIERYRDSRTVRLSYMEVMRAKEVEVRNRRQLELYDKSHARTRRGEQNRPSVRLNPRINIYPLLDSSVDGSDPQLQELKSLLSRLLRIVYGENVFYRELLAQEAFVEEALLNDVMSSARQMQERQRFTSVKDLARISLVDPERQILWYRLLKGNAAESCSDRFPPLSCFVDLRKKATLGLSIYHAPKVTLLALFQNSEVVAEIVQERQLLWREVNAESMTLEAATDAFESRFGKGRYLPADSALDFRVNTVRPPR